MNLVDEMLEMFKFASWGKTFTEDQVKTLCQSMEPRQCADGERIYSIHGKDPMLCFILKGKVVIKKDYEGQAEQIIVTFSPRTFFGEISVVDGLPHSASAVAKGATVLGVLPRDAYLALMDKEPELGLKLQNALLLVMGKRLRLTTLEYVRHL